MVKHSFVGIDNPMYGRKHSEETRKKLSKTWFKKGQIPWNKGLTKENSPPIKIGTEKMLKTKKSRSYTSWIKGKNKFTDGRVLKISLSRFGIKRPEIGKKISETRKRLFKDGRLKNHTQGKHLSLNVRNKIRLGVANAYKRGIYSLKPNKCEKLLIDTIKRNDLPFEFVGYGKIHIDGFIPDFINEDKKLVIEFFGDYWHNLSNRQEQDKLRFKSYNRNGFKILVIWEHELKDLNSVIFKMKTFSNQG